MRISRSCRERKNLALVVGVVASRFCLKAAAISSVFRNEFNTFVSIYSRVKVNIVINRIVGVLVLGIVAEVGAIIIVVVVVVNGSTIIVVRCMGMTKSPVLHEDIIGTAAIDVVPI